MFVFEGWPNRCERRSTTAALPPSIWTTSRYAKKWQPITSHVMNLMAKWRQYVANNPAELKKIQQYGLHSHVNLPWKSTAIRSDVVERFINTAHCAKDMIIGLVHGVPYVINPAAVIAILKLPFGTIETINNIPTPQLARRGPIIPYPS